MDWNEASTHLTEQRPVDGAEERRQWNAEGTHFPRRAPHRGGAVALAFLFFLPFLAIPFATGAWYLVANGIVLLTVTLDRFFYTAPERQTPVEADRQLNLVLAGMSVLLIGGLALIVAMEAGLIDVSKMSRVVEAMAIPASLCYLFGTLGYRLILPRIRKAA